MKKLIVLLGLGMLAAGSAVQAGECPMQNAANILSDPRMLIMLANTHELINWKVGDTANYNISVASMGNMGTSVKSVTSDTGPALWVDQVMDLTIQKQTVDMLINKADGKVLEMKQNGQDVAVPANDLTIISQDYESVTVPAGTFKAMHIVAKSSQASKIEVWANPTDTVMDGSLKEIVDAQSIEMTLELTSFKKTP